MLEPTVFSRVEADSTMQNQDWLKSPRELLEAYGMDLSTEEGVAAAAKWMGKTPEEFRELPIYQRFLRETFGGV